MKKLFLVTLVLCSTTSFTSDNKLKQPTSWIHSKPIASSKPAIIAKPSAIIKPPMVSAKPAPVQVLSTNTFKVNSAKTPTSLQIPAAPKINNSSSVNNLNNLYNQVVASQVIKKIINPSVSDTENRHIQSNQSTQEQDDSYSKLSYGYMQQLDQARIAAAIKFAQEKNLATVSQRLQLQTGNCISVFTVEKRVPGSIVSKEKLEKEIIFKTDLFERINKEAIRYAPVKEHAQLLQKHAKTIEQEIAAIKSQIIAIDTQKKSEKIKEIDIMVSVVKQLQDAQAENQIEKEKIEKELQESKKKKCAEIQQSFLLSAVNRCLGLMNLDVACDENDDHESKNDEEDLNKRYVMFKQASNNTSGNGGNSYNYNNPSDCYLFQHLPSGEKRDSTIKIYHDFQAYAQSARNAANQPTPLDLALSKLEAFAQCRQISPQDKLTLAREIYRLDAVRQDAQKSESIMKQLYKEEIVKHSNNHSLNPTEENLKLALALCENEARYHTHSDKAIAMAEKIIKGNDDIQKKTIPILPEGIAHVYKQGSDGIWRIDQEKTLALAAENDEKRRAAEQLKIDTARAQEEAQKAQELKNAQIQEAAEIKEAAELVKARAESAARQRANQAMIERNVAAQVVTKQVTHLKKQSESTQASITQSVIDRKNNQTLVETKKDSMHCCSMPVKTADDIRHQLTTSHHNENKKISGEETAMIDFMLNSMVHAQNNMTVELAQAGLQAWSDAQQAQTDEEYVHYVNKAKNCHNLMYYQTPGQSFIEQGLCVKPAQVDSMLHDCNAAIEHDKKYRSLNEQHGDTAYTQRLQKRQQALVESQDQIRTGALIYREYQMSYTARGFMITNNINYAAFDPMKATSFQHQLTQENLYIIESSVKIAEQNNFEPAIKEFAEQTCHLAVAAQQLNQLAKIEEAAAVTALNDSYARLMESIADDLAEAKAFKDLGVGVYKGTERALRAWGEFAGKLAMQPVTTVSEIGGNCLAVGNVLLHGAGNLADQALFGPARDSCDDFMQDMQELREKGIVAERKRRSQIRREENIDAIKDAYAASLEIAQQVITNMCKKNTEENIADATQFIVEGIITQKVAKYALQLSKFVGTGLVQGGLELLDKVPTSILDKPIEFMVTPGGAVMGVIAETGESIADIIIAAGEELAAPFEKGVHLAAQANNLARKGGGNSNGGKPEVKPQPVEPKVGTPEYAKKYPKGEYNDAKYHTSKGNSQKSPCPKDGQSALDRSFEVQDANQQIATQRIATEDGKIVILQYEGQGVYHGYLIEDFFSIKDADIQKALVKNGLVNSMKGGKIIK